MFDLNLILLLQAYLIFAFLLSVVLRVQQYRKVVGITKALPQRWPKTLKLVSEHHFVFLTWPTLAPSLVALSLLALHSIAINFVFPTANVSFNHLVSIRPLLIVIVLAGAVMIFLDSRAIFTVWQFDREGAEAALDQAEYWLRSPWSPAIRVLTLGLVNPRQMVRDEVYKALTATSGDLRVMMWKWAAQTSARLIFGLILWLTWAAT